MAIKKSELYSTLWASCDKLRGGMDASQYKDYVLVLLFVKYVSDKYAFSEDGFIRIPAGGSFADMVALKGNKDIGQGINRIILSLAQANGLEGIITQADFNDQEKLGRGREMQDKLSDLISIFENPDLDFSRNRAAGDDILGDAYEYLMRHFAAESGKSKGQFYTPAEVSRIMASLLGISPGNATSLTSAYDPTCGSGSLLLKIADQAGKPILLFGQEKEVTTAGLAKMNMILHNAPHASITKGHSTLSNPLFLQSGGLMKFDYAVSNPPFSSKNWTDGFNPYDDLYGRFELGIPPAKNGDYAFLLHIIHSLKDTGKGAVILPHGVLFRANAEADIRVALVKKGYITGIIGLPPNLFYGTGIPACLIIIDKHGAQQRKSIFMIDASGGFVKDGNKNRLREQDIRKIVDVFNARLTVDKYARQVSLEEIQDNDYNLNISRYIDNQPAEDMHDIQSHLLGDIPDRDIDQLALWKVNPSLRDVLFQPGRTGCSQLKVPVDQIRPVIFSHPDFKEYALQLSELFLRWKTQNTPLLENITEGMKPRDIIENIGQNLLETFRDVVLIDNYDIYQYLMAYWNSVMQDDLYTLVSAGWIAARQLESSPPQKKVLQGRIIPRELITSTFFATQDRELKALESSREAIVSDITALEQEHGGEDGLLSELINEKGKASKVLVSERLRLITQRPPDHLFQLAAEPDGEYGEVVLLKKLHDLYQKETREAAKIKTAAAALEKSVLEKYQQLSLHEIKTLVIELKWMKKLSEELSAETAKVAGRLADRVRQLAERYEHPLPQLLEHTHRLEEKLNTHLKKMGFSWK